VRDVALAHVLAMSTPRARGRYLCAAKTLHMREVVAIFEQQRLAERYRLPRLNLAHSLGNFVIRCASWFQPRGTGSYLRTNIGRRPLFDNSKIKRELGLTFRSVERSRVDTVQDLERWGHLTPRDAAAAGEVA
jgi:dihydroflavonol-4-reductase